MILSIILLVLGIIVLTVEEAYKIAKSYIGD